MKRRPSTSSNFMEEVDSHYEVMYVREDCSLRKFIEGIKGENSYERGCSYYELTEDAVDVGSGKEVIFMDKVNSNSCDHDS